MIKVSFKNCLSIVFKFLLYVSLNLRVKFTVFFSLTGL